MSSNGEEINMPYTEEREPVIDHTSCKGCINHSPKQSDHMDHDNGCLHDPLFCDICHMLNG